MKTTQDAKDLARQCEIDLTRDFFTLSASEVEAVLAAANEWRYRKPKNANGSRGRYFFAHLKRVAARK